MIPKAIRDQVRLHPGDEVEVDLQDDRIVSPPAGTQTRSAGDSPTVAWPPGCSTIAPESPG